MGWTDAIKEMGETKGLRVHRSHWMARGPVTAARRDRAILPLVTATKLPVSRRNVSVIREAGLLPRKSDG